MLNYAGMCPALLLSFVCHVTALKQNKIMSDSHIPIFENTALREKRTARLLDHDAGESHLRSMEERGSHRSGAGTLRLSCPKSGF